MIELYPEPPRAAIENSIRLNLDSSCIRCNLSANGCKTICLAADGEPGGVLLVGEAPGRSEDISSRPFVGISGAYLRKLVEDNYSGPVAFDNAVRCLPPQIGPNDKQIAACRPYLAQTIRDAKPERILCLGSTAVESVLGSSVAVLSARRGYSFLSDGTPVFILMHPAAALRNRFLQTQFESDLKWALTCKNPAPQWDSYLEIVTDSNIPNVYDDISSFNYNWIAFDCETYGLLWENDFRVISVAVAGQDSEKVWVWDSEALANPDTLELLERTLTELPVVGQNILFDIQAVKCGLGIKIPRQNIYCDTMMQRHLMDAESSKDLATMAYLVGMGGHKDEAMEYVTAVIKKPIKKNPDLLADQRARGVDLKAYAYAQIPSEILHRYNARDTIATARLATAFTAKLEKMPEINEIHEKIAKHLPYTFARISEWGFKIDRDNLEVMGDHLRGQLKSIRSKMKAFGDFDPGSTKQVAKLLFEDLELMPSKMSKKTGAASTDAEVLEGLRGKHPVVDLILQYRHVVKLLGTYADGEDGISGIVPHIRSDGRVHPSYMPTGTRTGRPSSSNPNILNIPRPENLEGKMARNNYVAEDGYLILSADASQIELRISALLSKDPVMTKIFQDGIDYHEATARMIAHEVWKVDYDAASPEKKKEMRTIAKTTNFQSAYNGTPEGLAKNLGCSVNQAAKIQNAILGKFKRFAEWSQEQIHYAEKTGYVWSYWNGKKARRRPMWKVADNDPKIRSVAVNGSVNTPVQSTASDYCLASIIAVVNWIEDNNLEESVKLVTTVYDSVILEVRKDMINEVAAKVKEIMLSWPSGNVPLAVDLEVGPAWGSLTKLEV